MKRFSLCFLLLLYLGFSNQNVASEAFDLANSEEVLLDLNHQSAIDPFSLESNLHLDSSHNNMSTPQQPWKHLIFLPMVLIGIYKVMEYMFGYMNNQLE